MRLMDTSKQKVTVMPAVENDVYQADDRLYRFDEEQAFSIRVNLQPLDGSSQASVNGNAVTRRLCMLYDGDEELSEGMGVSVETDSACDYCIAEPPKRYPNHWEAALSYIPSELRA